MSPACGAPLQACGMRFAEFDVPQTALSEM